MTKFKLGDRIIVTKSSNVRSVKYDLIGKCGKIVDISGYDGYYGIEFDDDIYGHSCNGKCKNSHGWFLPMNNVILDIINNYIDF